jgi:hypothetical protein
MTVLPFATVNMKARILTKSRFRGIFRLFEFFETQCEMAIAAGLVMEAEDPIVPHEQNAVR